MTDINLTFAGEPLRTWRLYVYDPKPHTECWLAYTRRQGWVEPIAILNVTAPTLAIAKAGAIRFMRALSEDGLSLERAREAARDGRRRSCVEDGPRLFPDEGAAT